MALPRGFRYYLPLGEVGIAFLHFRVGENIKFRFLALSTNETREIP